MLVHENVLECIKMYLYLKFWIKFNIYKKCSFATLLFYIRRLRNISTLKSKVNQKSVYLFGQRPCDLCFLKWKFLELIRLVCWCLGLVKTIIAGGVGGVSIWAAIYPFDLIKSRIQVVFFYTAFKARILKDFFRIL